MKSTSPKNNPRTGIIERGEQGIIFAGEHLMKARYAFSPRVGSTRWFDTFRDAKRGFDRAGAKLDT